MLWGRSYETKNVIGKFHNTKFPDLWQWQIQNFVKGGSIIRLRAKRTKFLRATPILIKTTPISARFDKESTCPTKQLIENLLKHTKVS